MKMFYCFSFSSYIVKVLIKMNVNISNEFHFSDAYRNINYTGSLAKFMGLIHVPRDPV